MMEEIHRALGRIEGELKGMKETQNTHGKKLNEIDKRVIGNEVKAARNGAIGGTLMSGFILLLKSTLS
ncbi:MAG: hypothetical protein COB77_04270 [Gammaproteobacteria bacterium]|nr:MAG: hypothetical protein COB77_04270 [Gammaproteobacteria bacterium]